jgi:hypothetical protein
MTEEPLVVRTQSEVYLRDIARDMKTLTNMLGGLINSMSEAESEVPERMRRFIIYMHCLHDIMYMYQEIGQEPPEYIKHEARRCDDRYRQLLAELNTDTGVFEKVRREMAADPMNRWDHTRQLIKPTHKGVVDEARKGNSQQHGIDEG